MPYLVADLVEGEPGLHRRVEKVAPVSSRNLTGWPPPVRVPWGSCVVLRTGAKWEALGPVNLDLGSEFLTPETSIPGDVTLTVISLASGARPWGWPLLAFGALSLKVSILATTETDSGFLLISSHLCSPKVNSL